MDVRHYFEKLTGRKFDINGNVYELIEVRTGHVLFMSTNDDSYMEMTVHGLAYRMLIDGDITVIPKDVNLKEAY